MKRLPYVTIVLAGLALSWTFTSAAQAPKPQFRSICVKHLELASSPDEIQSIAFRTAPQQARLDAKKLYQGAARVFLELPLTEVHFRKMYGDDATVTVRDEAEMHNLEQQISSGLGLRSHDGLSKATFKTRIAEAGKIVVVVGHNENGLFRFIDGSKEGLAELTNTCAAAGRLCVFVSCNADRFVASSKAVALNREIGFAASVELAQKIEKYVSGEKASGVSIETIQAFVQGIRPKDKKLYHADLLAFKGCAEAEGKTVLAVYVHAVGPNCGPNRRDCH